MARFEYQPEATSRVFTELVHSLNLNEITTMCKICFLRVFVRSLNQIRKPLFCMCPTFHECGKGVLLRGIA